MGSPSLAWRKLVAVVGGKQMQFWKRFVGVCVSFIIGLCSPVWLSEAAPEANPNFGPNQAEIFWLNEAQLITDDVQLLKLPVLEVATYFRHILLGASPKSPDHFRYTAETMIRKARGRLGASHADLGQRIAQLPQQPEPASVETKKLLAEFGNFQARTDYIRTSAETALDSFEATLSGNDAELYDGFSMVAQVIEMTCALYALNNDIDHAVTQAELQYTPEVILHSVDAYRAETLATCAFLRLDFLALVLDQPDDRSEFLRALSDLVNEIDRARIASERLVEIASSTELFAADTQSEGVSQDRVREAANQYIDVERSRLEVLRALRAVADEYERPFIIFADLDIARQAVWNRFAESYEN